MKHYSYQFMSDDKDENGKDIVLSPKVYFEAGNDYWAEKKIDKIFDEAPEYINGHKKDYMYIEYLDSQVL